MSFDTTKVPGVVRAEDLTMNAMGDLCGPLMKPQYSQQEVFGEHCTLTEHIEVPYERAFAYCADVMSLVEWTINIRRLEPVEKDLHRGVMVFSSEPSERETSIYIRADSLYSPDHGLICYPCAWDQGEELWMRYYFVLTNAEKTLRRPGTLVLWTNCKHPYYDRGTPGVPAYIAEGRSRTDRPWAGDAWPFFYAAHRLELTNLKRILEHRYRNDDLPHLQRRSTP